MGSKSKTKGKGNAKDAKTNSSNVVIDIRVYLLLIIAASALSLLLGVVYGPENVPGSAQIASLITKSDSSSATCAATNEKTTEAEKTTTKSCAEGGGGYECLPPLSGVDTSELHAPSGQHLLVDMKGIDADFLDSEERLTKAMAYTVEKAGLTMVSHHCHKLMPNGISCVGLLLESHISFHTWPEAGAITLDLFTCGDQDIVPLVKFIQEVFGIPAAEDVGNIIYQTHWGDSTDVVETKWSHELRGFHIKNGIKQVQDYSHVHCNILSPLDVKIKREIYNNSTKYHKMDIWSCLDFEEYPGHWDGIKHNLKPDDPRWNTQELSYQTPILFVDGFLQVSYDNDTTHYESLVHPGMFLHPNPINIAVVGDPGGGALRQVLAHKTIQSVNLIEIDDELIELYKELVPGICDCSDLIGRSENCFDDNLVTIIPEQFFDWFVNKNENESKEATQHDSSPLDVVIINYWKMTLRSEAFSNQENLSLFVSAVMGSLSDDGVFVIMVGEAPDISQPKAEFGPHPERELLIRTLEANSDVAAILIYEDYHEAIMSEATSFLVICKDVNCRSRWYSRYDIVDYEIYNRLISTKSGESPVKFYDGTMQYFYQSLPKGWETIYCRREPMPFECAYRHLDTKTELHDLYFDDEGKGSSSFELKMVKNDKGELEGPYVFAKVDITKGSYIMPEHSAPTLMLTDRNLDIVREKAHLIDDNVQSSQVEGSAVNFVAVGGTTMIRAVTTEEEANVGRWVPPHPQSGVRPVYSPVYDRHRVSFEVFMVATRDIPAGTQLFRKK